MVFCIGTFDQKLRSNFSNIPNLMVLFNVRWRKICFFAIFVNFSTYFLAFFISTKILAEVALVGTGLQLCSTLEEVKKMKSRICLYLCEFLSDFNAYTLLLKNFVCSLRICKKEVLGNFFF